MLSRCVDITWHLWQGALQVTLTCYQCLPVKVVVHVIGVYKYGFTLQQPVNISIRGNYQDAKIIKFEKIKATIKSSHSQPVFDIIQNNFYK